MIIGLRWKNATLSVNGVRLMPPPPPTLCIHFQLDLVRLRLIDSRTDRFTRRPAKARLFCSAFPSQSPVPAPPPSYV